MQQIFDQDTIQAGIIKVAEQISSDYEKSDRKILLVCVLKGGVVFLGQLLPKLRGNFRIDFITVSSYKDGTQSGDLELVNDLMTDPKDLDVIIIEDIVDSGKTIKFLEKHLQKLGANSIKVASLVKKTASKIEPDYYALEYNDPEFIVGFGFDVAEQYRNLPAIFKI